MRAPLAARSLVATALVAAAGLMAAPALAEPAAERDASQIGQSEDDLSIGTLLTAVTEVKLHRAIISKGSKVSVFRLSRKRGTVESVDVQLADGHVVREVAIAKIRSLFRVARD